MYGTKKALESTGVIGALIVIVSTIVQQVADYFGLAVTDVDLAEAVDLGTRMFQAGGGVLALYGRIMATKIIK